MVGSDATANRIARKVSSMRYLPLPDVEKYCTIMIIVRHL